MAPRTEQSEREFQSDINAAIAGTEDEIFREAMDASLDDNDGDHELESMGEGLEGDHIDEEIEVDDPDEPDEDGESDEDDAEVEASADDDDQDEDDDGQEDQQARDERGRYDRNEPRVPSSRLRESNEQRRQAEQRETQLRSELATVNARLNDVVTRLNMPQPTQPQVQQQAPAKPHMFVDPEGYEKWVLDEAERRATERVSQVFSQRDQQQQEQANRRVDHSFGQATRSNRGFEFQPAYNALTSLDPKNPQDRATVQGIYNAPDPAAALFEWWDDNGGAEYREQIMEQLGVQPRQQQPNRGQQRPRQQREPAREQVAPRYEYRGPKPMRSLNAASGSNAHRNIDDRTLDGTDASVFEYATKR